MSVINYLKESLKSPRVLAGRVMSYFDETNGTWAMMFKAKDGFTYTCLAESMQDTYNDLVWKLSMSKKIQGDTEMIDEKVAPDFVDALIEWVEQANPMSFYFQKSELYPAYNKIAEALAKKLKKEYFFLDESKVNHDDVGYDVIEESPERATSQRFIFHKVEPPKALQDKDWFEKKMADNDKTFGIYEQPEEIKPDPDHTTPFNKNGKLDKGVNYTDKKLK